jgi:hypothetical protein
MAQAKPAATSTARQTLGMTIFKVVNSAPRASAEASTWLQALSE